MRLGILTPSSNTVLEPVTQRLLSGLPEVSVHFSRLRVLRIALDEPFLRQFDPGPMVAAAELLADARTDVIGWSGTSAGWLGIEADHAVCAAIERATGIRATTSMLALHEALSLLGARRIGLVTPYTSDVQAAIVRGFAAADLPVIAERHLGDPGNFSFAEHSEASVASLMREVAAAAPDAIVTCCTNLRSTALAAPIEAETGIPVLDTVATVVWKALGLGGLDPGRVQGWGRLFALQPGAAAAT